MLALQRVVHPGPYLEKGGVEPSDGGLRRSSNGQGLAQLGVSR